MNRCIIPSSILEKLMCADCGSPLSVGPVRIRLNGQNICGRCGTPDMVPPALNFAYEAAASIYLFPCMYKPNGCTLYVPYNDTTQHENSCSYIAYQCPVKSDCVWIDIIEKLPEHYLADHPDLCIEDTSITLPLENDLFKPYLIYQQGLYFLLQANCIIAEAKLWFNFVYLGDPETVQFMQYTLQLGSNQTETCILVEQHPILPHMDIHMHLNKSNEVHLNGVKAILKEHSITCAWNIKIDQKFQQEQSQLAELQCRHCDEYMTPPIYICNKGHILCADCKGFEMDCIECKDENIITPLIRALFLENLSKKFKFPCRWKGCAYKGTEIRKHEQSCLMRKYQCPFKICAKWLGSLIDLAEHLKTLHPHCNVHVDPTATLYDGELFTYIIAHGELFWCIFTKTENNERLLQVFYKGPPSSASTFMYELEVVNSSGISKVYGLARFIKNRYEVRIPILNGDDTDTKTADDVTNTYSVKIIKRCESQINLLV